MSIATLIIKIVAVAFDFLEIITKNPVLQSTQQI